MFTDIAGYTAMMQRDERSAVEARSRHRAALYGAVEAHNGEIFQFLGDGGVSVFSSAVEAVRAAIRVQASLEGPERLPLRIGIHHGEITWDEQGIVGDTVNVAARVQELSEPGGITITAKVQDELRNHPDLAAIGLGSFPLKGIDRPVEIYAVTAPGVVFPDAVTPREGAGSGSASGIHERLLRNRVRPPAVDAARPAEPPARAFVGREAELSAIDACLDAAGRGRGGTLLFRGEGGVGKTRLAEAAKEKAERLGWDTAVGRANPVEADRPYALCADVLLPALRALGEDARNALTRGVQEELAVLFPTLVTGATAIGHGRRPESPDFRNRLFWNLAHAITERSAERPILIVLEDLQWADASSLELFHFLARQTHTGRVVFVCTYREESEHRDGRLHEIERSLVSLGVAALHAVRPLTYASTDELVRRTFQIPESISRSFTAMLFGWTRGNPFFMEEVLKALVASGELHREGGAWLGWEVEELKLPESVRETVMSRVERLGAPAARVADLAAVLGGRVSFAELRAVSGLSHDALLPVLDELEAQRIFVDAGGQDQIAFEFWHPIVGETLYTEMGRARAGVLHGVVAQALERHYGASSLEHAGVLAYHYARAIDRVLADKAVRYLDEAGRSALAAYANPEALKYLSAALERTESAGTTRPPVQIAELISRLAHAHQRLGRTSTAIDLWKRALAILEGEQDAAGVSRVQRHLGLAHYWTGHAAAALDHFDAGARAAQAAGDPGRLAMLQVARGLCLQELGRADEALAELREALAEAERSESARLLARVHRALLLIYLWTGPPDAARSHGEKALQYVAGTNDVVLSFWVHWAMAVLAGLTGNAERMSAHLGQCRGVADQLRSPLLQMWAAELAIEFAFGEGRWDEGLAIGENAISMARALDQHTLLPRLLVWTALIHLGRHDLDRGRAYVEEAWRLAIGRDAGPTGPQPAGTGHGVEDARRASDGDRAPAASIHAVIPAHIGRAAYYLATEDYEAAIATAEAGLRLVDRTGYDVWAVHRLLPIAAEASLYLHDVDRALRFGVRLRASAERFQHRLGLAWSDACDAITIWMSGDPVRGGQLMRAAADKLEAIPFMPDATRLRRQLAGRLAETGDREGALRELRRVHAALLKLGAEKELERTRRQFEELGVTPPGE